MNGNFREAGGRLFPRARSPRARARRPSVLATILLLAVVAVVGFALPETIWSSGIAPPTDDGRIYELLDELRARADAIRIDGQGDDWVGIPCFTDEGPSALNPAQHLVSVSVAPREEDLLILLRTAQKPDQRDHVFGVQVTLGGLRGGEFEVLLSPHDNQLMRALLFEDDHHAVEGAEAVFGEVIEVRIPYTAFVNDLRWAQRWGRPNERGPRGPIAEATWAGPWVRVFAYCRDPGKNLIREQGPAAASYRLVRTPCPLDSPLPEPRFFVSVPLPLRGSWYVSQGPFGILSHQRSWACDLCALDAAYRFCPGDPAVVESWYGWGQPVFSPTRGRVVLARSDTRDGDRGTPANAVVVDMGNGLGLKFEHLQRGTVAAACGEQVRAGQLLGHVGNSGWSTGPHLHFACVNPSDDSLTGPFAFSNVRVSLNPGPDDPWARALQVWQPRQGYFVEKLKETR